MNAMDLLEIIGEADDSYIRDAREGRKNMKTVRFRWAVLAASIMLVVGGIAIGSRSNRQQPLTNEPQLVVSEDGVTLPTLDVSLAPRLDGNASMTNFFIYEGRCYIYYASTYDTGDLIGEHLGTVTGWVKDWTASDGYVDYAGSSKGAAFYSVKGYDPSFMLCQKYANGDAALFICKNGITMKYGAELYRDRLHLSEGYIDVQYETRSSRDHGRAMRYSFRGDAALIEQFLRDLDEALFMSWTQIPHILDEGRYDEELWRYQLVFPMRNGTTVRLRLLEGGYVIYEGIQELCVRVPEDSFGALLAALESDTDAIPAPPPPGSRTLEDCRADPDLGSYVPDYMPEEFSVKSAEIFYYIDPGTGRETGTKEMNITYSDAVDRENSYLYERSYWITITWAEEYGENGWAGPMLDASELSPDAIAGFGRDKTKGYPLAGYYHNFGVWFGDVSVVISAEGLDEETIYQILKSIR